ncbi:MAG TPA: MBL fold metallo-hydrolase [Pyrinomonadaceae bacterium]|jgi:glyoxylase-like metal-dependent hydrolase (beta-lactamase superfamily II)|nr:MBL fold metallo-hydrolase [Pyrinomonadaceae bacterium]
MKRTAVVSGLAAACLALAAGARAQQDFSKVQMKATRAGGNVYMLEGAGGNIGVSVGSDGVLIVDDQFAPLAEKIRAAVKELNPGALRFVLNTHFHGDHTGANAAFGKESTIIAHDNVRKRLAAEQTVLGGKVPASPKEALPVITYAQSVSIHFNDEEIRVIHFPHGHTDGDSVIFFTRSNVVHMGDDFFAGRFPFVDIGNGGDVLGLTKNVGDIIAQVPADVKLIPGHGPLSALDDLKSYHRMLLATTDIVRKQIAAGKTLEQIKAAGLPDEWKAWGSGFINTERWLETVHRSLTNQKGAQDTTHH